MAKKGPFKMKGHTLPGINQRSETKNMADGRSKSSAFQANAAAGAKAGKGAFKNPNLSSAQAAANKAKFSSDIKKFGEGLKGSFKDIKYGLAGKAGREKMTKAGFENVKTRKAKYGTSSWDKSKRLHDKNKDKISDFIQPHSVVGNTIPKGQETVSSKMNVNKPKGSNLDKMSFKDAFKSSRKSGAKEFTWKGKKYHTKTKSEMGGKTTKTYSKDSPSNPKNFSTTPKNKKKFIYTIPDPTSAFTKKSAAKKKKSPAKNYKKGYYGA